MSNKFGLEQIYFAIGRRHNDEEDDTITCFSPLDEEVDTWYEWIIISNVYYFIWSIRIGCSW